MFELNDYVDKFIGGNWLAILVFLTLLKGIARQFKNEWVHKLYMVLQDCYKIVRPGSAIEEKPNVPK